MSTTNLPNGVTTASRGQTLGQFILPDPTKAHVFFDDFTRYVAADWTVTEVGIATQALTDLAGGNLLITNAAADNNSSFSQLATESFGLSAGKKAWFKARFKVSDATQSDFVIGLQITDTTPLAVSDGVWFQKDDGDALLDLHVAASSTQTDSTGLATIADDTFVDVGWYDDGASKIHAFVNDVAVVSVATTNRPSTLLTVSYGVQNGEAVAKTMTVDYILAAIER